MRYIPAIDGLRAIAVLAVVAYHAGLPVPAGFVGVDVFFVISGYLITRLLHEELASTGRINFAAFYARRARRILPAAVVVTLVILILSLWLLPPQQAADAARSAGAASVFVANLFFLTHSDGYWGASADTMPLLHMWSLSVEEQFYLLWPLLLTKTRKLLWVVLGSFLLAEIWMRVDPIAAFYQMPARSWELAVGGLIALHRPRMPQGTANVGLLLVLVSALIPIGHFPGAGALMPVLGATAVIAGLQSGQAPWLLTTRSMVGIGLISYSLYLWHWPLLAIARAQWVGDLPLWLRLALVALAFALAALSYRYIEQPFRRTRAPHKRVISIGAGVLAVVSSAAYALGVPPPPPPPAPPTPSEIAANDRPSVVPCHFLLGQPVIQGPKPTCNPGAKVLMWGDSYALAWKPFADAVAAQDGERATALSRDHCPSIAGAIRLATKAESDRCQAFNTQAIAYIQTHNIDTVILASRWSDVLPENGPGFTDATRQIAPHVRRLLVIGPTPEMPEFVPKCIEKGVECSETRSHFENRSKMARDFLATLPVEVIVADDYFCTRAICAGTRGGRALYFDDHHVSSTAAMAVARRWLSPNR